MWVGLLKGFHLRILFSKRRLIIAFNENDEGVNLANLAEINLEIKINWILKLIFY